MRGRPEERLGIKSNLNFGEGGEVKVSWILGFKKEKCKLKLIT